MCEPGYRDIQSADIPEVTTAHGVLARVIAGHSHGAAGAVQRPHTDPLYLDLRWPAATAVFEQPLPDAHNAFLYVYRGGVEVIDAHGDASSVPLHRMAILANEGDGVRLRASAQAQAILIAGQPLREPIAQYGPFVMNTREQLMQAVDDFRSGRLGR